MKKILVTGGAGFIGANFIKSIATRKTNYEFVILDALTYAGHYPTIQDDIDQNEHIRFVQMDIRHQESIRKLFLQEKFDGLIHFAAESHVDHSISKPNIFVETNVLGTLNLLNASLEYDNKDFRFLQVSTDEVYGSLKDDEPAFTEETALKPNSPYSASKASADCLVRSYYETYDLQTIITRCSNNYGPYQFPEKLIPLMIQNAMSSRELPVYGDGKNVRDWIYVDDHVSGVWKAFLDGRAGEVYNFGGDSEERNINVVREILKILDKPKSLITYVEDRKGHDWRYAINFDKAIRELGWKPTVTFEEGLKKTVQWYLDNQDWVKAVGK